MVNIGNKVRNSDCKTVIHISSFLHIPPKTKSYVILVCVLIMIIYDNNFINVESYPNFVFVASDVYSCKKLL